MTDLPAGEGSSGVEKNSGGDDVEKTPGSRVKRNAAVTRDNSWASVIVSLLTLLHGWKILNWFPSGREESTYLRKRSSVGGLTFQRVLRMLTLVVSYIRDTETA